MQWGFKKKTLSHFIRHLMALFAHIFIHKTDYFRSSPSPSSLHLLPSPYLSLDITEFSIISHLRLSDDERLDALSSARRKFASFLSCVISDIGLSDTNNLASQYALKYCAYMDMYFLYFLCGYRFFFRLLLRCIFDVTTSRARSLSCALLEIIIRARLGTCQ